MWEKLVLFLIFLVWSLAVTPLSIFLSRQYGIVDEPGGRKRHPTTTPRGAGVVIWVGYLLYAILAPNPGGEVRLIATGATAVFLFGYMDDMHPLPASWKLAAHLAAAVTIAWSIPVQPAVKAAVILWVTGTTSAYNLVDGINGLSLAVFSLTALTGFSPGDHGGLLLSGFLWVYCPGITLSPGPSLVMVEAPSLVFSAFPSSPETCPPFLKVKGSCPGSRPCSSSGVCPWRIPFIPSFGGR